MNNYLVTTGVKPLMVGSVEVFQVQPWLGAQPWNLTGGSATLLLRDPDQNLYTIPAAVNSGGGATAQWTVANVPGDWIRAWMLADATGRSQTSNPIVFSVQQF